MWQKKRTKVQDSGVPRPRPKPRLRSPKTKTKTKTQGFQDQDQDQDFNTRVSRRLETKTQVSRTTSLPKTGKRTCHWPLETFRMSSIETRKKRRWDNTFCWTVNLPAHFTIQTCNKGSSTARTAVTYKYVVGVVGIKVQASSALNQDVAYEQEQIQNCQAVLIVCRLTQ